MRVEFYGLARLRAGRKDLLVSAATVGEALAACPKLRALHDGQVSATYLVSVNGDRFTTDARLALVDGDEVLIFGADAGG